MPRFGLIRKLKKNRDQRPFCKIKKTCSTKKKVSRFSPTPILFFFFFSYFYLFSFDTLFLPVNTLVVNVWKVVTFTSLCNTELTVVLVVVICIFFKCWCVDAHFWGNFWPIGKRGCGARNGTIGEMFAFQASRKIFLFNAKITRLNDICSFVSLSSNPIYSSAHSCV